MWTALVLWLYGSLLIVGGFLATFWFKFAAKRSAAIEHRWFKDRYLILASGLALWTAGQVILNTGRLIGNVVHGLSSIMLRIEGWFIALGLLLVLGASFFFVWLADLEEHPPRWRYLRGMAIATLAWAAVAAILPQYMPMMPYLPDWLQGTI